MGRALLLQAIDDASFETFEPDRPELQNLRNMIRRRKSILITKSNQRPVLRTVDQPQLGFEHDRARAFRSDQRARHVKSIFRQQLIEVVAGDPARNFRKARADQVAVLVADGSAAWSRFRRAARPQR